MGVAALLAVGCDMFNQASPVTKKERVQDFMSDLEAEHYDNLADHLHPSYPNRSQLDDPTVWTQTFGTGNDFPYSDLTESGDQVTILVNSTSSEYDGTWSFDMKEGDPDVWYINGIHNTTKGTDYVQ